MALVMFEIVVGQQDLGNAEAGLGKKLFVSRHQPGLADGGAGLQLRKFRRPFFVAQCAHACTHRARRDNDDLFSQRPNGGDLARQLFQLR